MRTSLVVSAALLSLGFALPAEAQMCGRGQAAASTSGGSAAMCGMTSPGPNAATADPDQTRPGRQASGCPCCRSMAMMGGGGTMGGMGSSPQDHGMQHGSPEAPKP